MSIYAPGIYASGIFAGDGEAGTGGPSALFFEYGIESARLGTFAKQPQEVRDFDVLFANALESYNDSASEIDPIEIGPVPAGIVLNAVEWLATEQIMKFWVSDAAPGLYTLTAWLNTTGGRRWEVEIKIRAREIG